MPTLKNFKIGADPEFVGVHVSSAAYAGDFLSHMRFDRDAGDGDKNGVFDTHSFGSDGRPFEIRPPATEDPLDLVESIAEIFRCGVTGNPELSKLTWRAGSFQLGQPLGGHIHFGIGHALDFVEATDMLDSYLGSILAMVEGSAGRYRRNTGYGGPGAYRDQGYGFEYRTPGSWLTSPYVAAACLCLAKAVVSELLNNKGFPFKLHAKVDSNPPIQRNYLSIPDPSSAIRLCQIDLLRKKFPAIWDDITRMALYQEYKPYIDVLYFLVTNKLTWHSRVGMKAAWGIEEIQLPMPRSVQMDAIWSRYRERVCHG